MAQFALADELADYLGTTFEAAQIAQVDLLLQLASAAIQSDAHQTLEYVKDDPAPLRGTYSGELWLPERPVHDVTEVEIRNGNGWPLSLSMTTDQFAWDRGGLMRRGAWLGSGVVANADVCVGGWGGPYATVVVTYSHGFEVIPDDIKGVCLSAAGRLMSNGGLFSNPNGASEEETDGYRVVYANNDVPKSITLVDEERAVTHRYRPVVFV